MTLFETIFSFNWYENNNLTFLDALKFYYSNTR
jgi:hypothetical protein